MIKTVLYSLSVYSNSSSSDIISYYTSLEEAIKPFQINQWIHIKNTGSFNEESWLLKEKGFFRKVTLIEAYKEDDDYYLKTEVIQ